MTSKFHLVSSEVHQVSADKPFITIEKSVDSSFDGSIKGIYYFPKTESVCCVSREKICFWNYTTLKSENVDLSIEISSCMKWGDDILVSGSFGVFSYSSLNFREAKTIVTTTKNSYALINLSPEGEESDYDQFIVFEQKGVTKIVSYKEKRVIRILSNRFFLSFMSNCWLSQKHPNTFFCDCSVYTPSCDITMYKSKSLKRINNETGEVVHVFGEGSDLSLISIISYIDKRSGREIVVAGNIGNLLSFFDSNDGKLVLTRTTVVNSIVCVCISNHYLFCGLKDGVLEFFDLRMISEDFGKEECMSNHETFSLPYDDQERKFTKGRVTSQSIHQTYIMVMDSMDQRNDRTHLRLITGSSDNSAKVVLIGNIDGVENTKEEEEQDVRERISFFEGDEYVDVLEGLRKQICIGDLNFDVLRICLM